MPGDAERRFIQAWRYAAPELEKIQRRELRDLDKSAGLEMIGAPVSPDRPYSGLIEFQAWMMRLRIMQLNEQLARREPSSEAGT